MKASVSTYCHCRDDDRPERKEKGRQTLVLRRELSGCLAPRWRPLVVASSGGGGGTVFCEAVLFPLHSMT